jgi:hypothetical protein
LPTPIEHLIVAERILASPQLPETVRVRLDASDVVRGAYFFGHIAPDVQVVSRQPREVTHFFTLPPAAHQWAYSRMLAAHPDLTQPEDLSPLRTAFLAGYLSHLLLDEFWVRKVFYPIFGPHQTWEAKHERLLLHNVLRAWLDRRDLPKLRDGLGQLLRFAEPNEWLPFASDTDLSRWRDIVAEQFAPGAGIRTVEIFANRARIPDSEFLALLEPSVMNRRVFSRVNLNELDRFNDQAVVHTLDLTVRYLDGCIERGSV